MLIKATLEDIKKYGEFAYSLALNPAKSCYPTYADGIKTKTDFFKAAEGAIAKETYELLLFSMDGNIEGWISYYWIPEDKYLQLYEFNISRGAKQALTELIKTIETKFRNYYNEEVKEGYLTAKECDYTCFLKYREVSNYLDDVEYYINNKNLVAYRPFATKSIFSEEEFYKEETFAFQITGSEQES